MKLVALVSGGKDSCFNMMECIRYGHEIVALANLLPENQEIDELDSYMYQTVGHQMVGVYAECMGLPLFRRRIRGTAREQGLRYTSTAGDEVEDLLALLTVVKAQMPEVEGVSSGAIASDYQRMRVEHVCGKLGLISFAYLWQLPQSTLLQAMIDEKVQAILVKVAALGLDPHQHLGKDLSTMQPILKKLNRLYGINECGEGGEYETLTLDCPLFKHAHIVLDEFEILIQSPGSIASVGVLHPTRYHLKSKIPSPDLTLGQLPAGLHALDFHSTRAPAIAGSSGSPRIIYVESDIAAGSDNLTNSDCSELHPEGLPSVSTSTSKVAGISGQAENPNEEAGDLVGGVVKVADSGLQLSASFNENGFATISCRRTPSTPPLSDAGKELSAILGTIELELRRRNLSWAHVLYIHLYLADMADFGAANAAYMSTITEAECTAGVPSRSTVEVPLGAAQLGCVMADALVAAGPPAAQSKAQSSRPISELGFEWTRKHVLHVQSFSSWAPCCIGPYSQATEHQGLVHMAGQLGLDPASMKLAEGGAAAEARRALQSCEAVARAMGSSVEKAAIALTVYCAASLGREERTEIAGEVDRFLFPTKARPTQATALAIEHAPLDDLQGTHKGHASSRLVHVMNAYGERGEEEEEEEEDTDAAGLGVPPLLQYVVVTGLPKGALVEIAPLLCVHSPEAKAYSSDSSDGEGTAPPEQGNERDEDLEALRSAKALPTGGKGACKKAPRWISDSRSLVPSSGRRGSEEGAWKLGVAAGRHEKSYVGQSRDESEPSPTRASDIARSAVGRADQEIFHSTDDEVSLEGIVVPGSFCRAHASIRVRLHEQIEEGVSEDVRGISGDTLEKDGNGKDILDTAPVAPVIEESAVRRCLLGLEMALRNANLSWEAVTVLRVYFVSSQVPLALLEPLLANIWPPGGGFTPGCVANSVHATRPSGSPTGASTEAGAASPQEHSSLTAGSQETLNNFCGAKPIFVPVLGVGPNASAKATLAMELTAVGQRLPV